MLTPEQILWRAVLNQAYEDAEMGAEGGDDVPESPDRIRGRRFLRADSPLDAAVLRLICDYADVPADRVILWARQHYSLAA